MYGRQKKKICVRSFEMPHESNLIEMVYNDPNANIISEQVFQDKSGSITILLKYETLDIAGTRTAPRREERQVEDIGD